MRSQELSSLPTSNDTYFRATPSPSNRFAARTLQGESGQPFNNSSATPTDHRGPIPWIDSKIPAQEAITTQPIELQHSLLVSSYGAAQQRVVHFPLATHSAHIAIKGDVSPQAWASPIAVGAALGTLFCAVLLLRKLRCLFSKAKPHSDVESIAFPPALHPFSLDQKIFSYSKWDGFTFRMLCEHVGIWGGSGSGKSSGPGARFARSILKSGLGVLVCCVKPDETSRWIEYANETLRLESLLVVSPGGKWRCNLFEYLLKRPGTKGSKTELVTELFMTIYDLSQRGVHSRGDQSSQFFKDATRKLVRKAVEICVRARNSVSVAMLNDVIKSLPSSHDEVHDSSWQERSFCYQLILEGESQPKTDREEKDFALAAEFLLQEFLNYAPETRGSVIATWGVMAEPLLTGDLADLFGSTTNFVPDLTFHGTVIVLDLPAKVYGRAGVIAQAAFAYVWQWAVEQREIKHDTLPVCWFVDEAPALLTPQTADFLATCRSSRCGVVLMGQNLSTYYSAFGGDAGKHQVENVLGNCSTHIFGANAHPETNAWASKLISKEWRTRSTFGSSHGGESRNASAGGSESLESKVLEAEFTSLRKGGPENNYCVDTIVFQGGRVFHASGDTYLRTTFQQERRA